MTKPALIYYERALWHPGDIPIAPEYPWVFKYFRDDSSNQKFNNKHGYLTRLGETVLYLYDGHLYNFSGIYQCVALIYDRSDLDILESLEETLMETLL